MATRTITFTLGTTPDTTPVLSDTSGAYGIKRDDTDVVVVADGTAMSGSGTTWTYQFTEPEDGLTYTYSIEYVLNGSTYYYVDVDEDVSYDDYSTLGGMRALWREVTGLSTTSDITDASVNNRLNRYYTTVFPKLSMADTFEADITQDLTATDSGEYTLSARDLKLASPVTINKENIDLYTEKAAFWEDYPEGETFITVPSLAIGTSNKAHIKNSAFIYKIAGWSYDKASTETALSGDAVPQSKYGAWKLTVDADGDITVTAASGNSTGYATSALAVNALTSTSASSCCMGYVTAINTSSTFTPGTTELDATGVTATYTDGDPKLRGQPSAAMVDGRTLYVRPKPDDKYRLEAKKILRYPEALSSDSDSMFNEEHGMAVVYGDAAAYLQQQGDEEKAQEVARLRDFYTNSVRTDRWLTVIETTRMRAL